jgi:alanine-glyoxylate transaminase/serine-glyoxylate transaminase/serine-pyruvate transaminase
MTNDLSELNVPYRLLLGPGPSAVHPRVYRAMMQPVIGMFDPVFIQLLDDTQRPLRTVFRTENDFTMAISGTGTAGMEAAIYNIVEPGDTAVVCRNGYFGMRMSEMVERCGGTVVPVEAPWGTNIEPERVEEALKGAGRVKVVAVVHGETSTGALQPLEEISRIAHAHDALLLVDAVTSLAGCELRIDDWGIDVCYSGTQKCLSAPPGMAPLTMSAQAMEVVANRKEPPRSWYVDLTMLGRYWGGGSTTRAYHHTPPMTMLYALREGLRIVLEEGIEPRIARHIRNSRAFWAGIEAMGLTLHVEEKHRLTPLTTVRVPEGVDELAVRTGLLMEHNIEIGRGFGALEGKVWRVGLMGYGSSEENVLSLLYALETQLTKQKFGLDSGAGVAAAARSFAQNARP